MTSKTTTALVLLASLTCAACAHSSPEVHQSFPPRADLTSAPEPPVPDEALTSEKAANDYSAAVLTWGRGLQAQVDRLCRWAADNGMRDMSCPAPPR